MKVFLVVASLFLLPNASSEKQSSTKYVTGTSIFGSNSCPGQPVFVGSVFPISPAASGGLRVGDQLLSIDGKSVAGFKDASARMSSIVPHPVILKVRRRGSIQILPIDREEYAKILSRNNLRLLEDGSLVGTDYSDAEIEEYRSLTRDLSKAIEADDFVNVFPTHYPVEKSLYYPGFEIFVWNKGSQVRVGGIENGPAKQSGIRWGDRIVLVNGSDPQGKSLLELESLFSSSKPTTMHLLSERAGVQMPFSFQLDKAATILKTNNWKIAEGKMVPLWLPTKYTKCF